jgi:hypothetical protein
LFPLQKGINSSNRRETIIVNKQIRLAEQAGFVSGEPGMRAA